MQQVFHGAGCTCSALYRLYAVDLARECVIIMPREAKAEDHYRFDRFPFL